VRLRDTLGDVQGKWMVSYNDCDYIRDLYQDFHIIETTRINNLAQRYDGGCEFPELIITRECIEMVVQGFFAAGIFIGSSERCY